MQEKNDLCICDFSLFSQHFLFDSWFLFRLDWIFSSAWHDMTINFFFYSHDWSTPGNDACHRWPSKLKHLFLCKDLFWKDWLLVWGCSYHFCPEKDRAQKYSREMGNFWSMCLEASIKVISEYHDLGILFCTLKRFGRFETVASLDAYQITKYQFFFLKKTRYFFVALFSKNSKNKFPNQEFMVNCLSRRDQKVHFFFKIVSFEAPRSFYSNGFKVKMSVC